MNYEDALEYIHSRPAKAARRTDLSRIGRLLSKLGDPQKDLRYIHIAGSNGKGSTAAMCSSVLVSAGFKTGLFISPYVFDFRERMQIDGKMVPKQTVADMVSFMLPKLAEMEREGEPCTEFEVVTALAFCLFCSAQCDIVVLEVGIGGRLDCTNIISTPLAAAITSVSLDHMDILGDTIAKIAAEKCGILKADCAAIGYCNLHEDARRVLIERANSLGITPIFPDLNGVIVKSCTENGSDFQYMGRAYHTALAGEYQIYNALTVIEVMKALSARGIEIPYSAVAKGLAETAFPGRLQVVRKAPLCIIDGAHNPEKIRSLCTAIDRFFSDRKIITVMGMLEKKDYLHCVPQLARRSDIFIATTPCVPRAVPAERTAQCARDYCKNVEEISDAKAAARRALALSDDNSVAIACGSFYMLGDAKLGFQP